MMKEAVPGTPSSCLQKLKEHRKAFSEVCTRDLPGLLAAQSYAQKCLDALKTNLANPSIPKKGWCLAAVGGFGRGELSFASDLDLLFLYRNGISSSLEGIIRDLTYGLWDEGFEVGHVTASVTEARRLVEEDFTALTNHLESSFIAGEWKLYDQWRKAFLGSFGSKKRRRFVENLLENRQARLRQYGESSYLLEPHVKEGVGGLRDQHIIRWAGLVFFQTPSLAAMVEREWLTREEMLWLEQAYDFLWRVRLQIHQLTGRRQDQLLFPEQETVAGRLGYEDTQQGLAVEAFMRLYYRYTARIRRTTSFFLERLEQFHRKSRTFYTRRKILPGPLILEGHHLHFLDSAWIKKDPRLLMQIFWQAAKTGAHFHHQTGGVIRENLGQFTDGARCHPETIQQFFDILLNPKYGFSVLKNMHETGFLDVFIPEFAAIRYRVQHDVYHLYTVDEHSLRTVRALHNMEHDLDESLVTLGLKHLFTDMENRRVLYLAALLHDIGKGQGKNHATRGATLAKEIAMRLQMQPEEIELMGFLVENHLLLAETALKRDLMDEKPILNCAIKIADRQRLKLLYLLTIADSTATGPGAWNAWKASLLRELFHKVDRMLTRGDWSGEDIQLRSQKIQKKVLELAGSSVDLEKLSQWLDRLSFRYLLSQSAEAILHHYSMEMQLKEKSLVLHAEEKEGEMWQITLATRDRPGLFAIIAGVLWVRGLNILSADIFTRESGVALDVLIVEHLPDPLHSRELWEKIEYDLIQSLRDRAYLLDLLTSKRRPSWLQHKCVPRKEDRVIVDEDASDFYTIIEVYTWDRPGVLHVITNTLYQLDISIQLAKISTPGAQVADVFYVTDLSGNKIMDVEIHENIRRRLLDALSLTC